MEEAKLLAEQKHVCITNIFMSLNYVMAQREYEEFLKQKALKDAKIKEQEGAYLIAIDESF